MNASSPFLSIEERRALRRPLSVPIEITGGALEKIAAELVDLSPVGCRVRLVVEVKVGSLLAIGVPGFTTFSGWVAWTSGQEIGLEFANPLPNAVVEHIASSG